MKKINLRAIVVIGIIASVLLPVGQVTKTFGAEPVLDTDSVNEVGLRTIFYFREGTETINTFKNFDTMSSGFDRTKPVTFKLEGVIGWDRPILYKAIDTTFVQGKGVMNDFTQFEVDVIFQRGDQPFRIFHYTDCKIKNYNVYTEYDREETYNLKTDFVYLDKIEFDCIGFDMGNPTYDKMIKDKTTEKTADAMKMIDQKKNGKK